MSKMLATLFFQLPRLDFSGDDVVVFCTKFHWKRTRETQFQGTKSSHLFRFKCAGMANDVANV